ncbi:MAG TPA: TA system VapC family ribonuclease toxin [Candidatus Binatia bacterium]|nr:TA system VapC family ribonuclease toxin [Candidatus Binatia bacterium]
MTATVDANILLYASDADSPLHARAAAFVERLAQGPELLYLFWPTIVAYVRLATHPAIFSNPLTLAEALGNVEQLVTRAHVQSPGEQPGFWRRLRSVVTEARAIGNLVSDAHLVALMQENGVRIIWTHDRDFRRFDGIEVRDPFA